jgi:hypothetical protein
MRTDDIDIIYEDIIEKNDNNLLDLPSFTKISADYPELLDFFDIFNNKVMQNMSIVINRDHIKRIEKILAGVKRLMDKIVYSNSDHNKFTISMKSWVDRIVKNRQSAGLMRSGTFNNNKMFVVSRKVTEYQESDVNNQDVSFISESSHFLSEPSDKNNTDRHKTETINSQKGMDGFEFINPGVIKNEEYMKELADNGIDLTDCLIVNRKASFLNYLTDLREELTALLKEYDYS